MSIVADAYRGRAIADAMHDFMSSASGRFALAWENGKDEQRPDMVVYVGHNGLMDAPLQWVKEKFPKTGTEGKQAAVLACKSAHYFSAPLAQSGARPVVVTYDFMAPEAYVVHAIAEGLRHREREQQIRQRAAEAYARYQKISVKSAGRVFGVGK